MFPDVHFTIGLTLALVPIILIFLVLGLLLEDFLPVKLLLISIVLVITLRELSSSSAAPPACLDGFIVETNGGTGAAHTCTTPAL